MKRFSVGVDVGNYDTKTDWTVTPSGLDVTNSYVYGMNEYVLYNGKYYTPSEDRFFFKKDKMNDDNMYILTLIAIAKEIVLTAEKKGLAKDEIQEFIDGINLIDLGVGLPPAHMAQLSEKMESYYKSHFEENGSFEYNNYKFNLKLGLIKTFPQDFAAIMTHRTKNENSIRNVFDSYYGIDIGGYTVDFMPVVKGKPSVAKCISLEMGVLRLYDEIAKRTDIQFGTNLENSTIESILNRKPVVLKNEAIEPFVLSCAEEWVLNIIDALQQSGAKFDQNPVIFLGGGSELFKQYIKKNENIVKMEFISGQNANARGYRKLIATMSKSLQKR